MFQQMKYDVCCHAENGGNASSNRRRRDQGFLAWGSAAVASTILTE